MNYVIYIRHNDDRLKAWVQQQAQAHLRSFSKEVINILQEAYCSSSSSTTSSGSNPKAGYTDG